jgi:Rab-GTPase-TBC domain
VSIYVVCSFVSRWVRLLFGREFPMQDLLMLWDAIFADSISFDLVDYVFVAMLLYIRDASKFLIFILIVIIMLIIVVIIMSCV